MSVKPGDLPLDTTGSLHGIRIVEEADETAEYCGLTLAGLGADVVKLEPAEGASTRHIGPFLNDKPGPERSLHFWAYNRGKRSVIGTAETTDLLANADVLLTSRRDLDVEALRTKYPSLIIARITPFGDVGPWKDFKGSDLIHLALGGIMMNCGYDPDPAMHYDLPPIAPQLWQAYNIAGEQMVVGILAALLHRLHTGEGQYVSCSVHEAVSKNPELDYMSWVMRRAPLYRMTCRHAGETPSHVPTIGHTKDGRWYIAAGVSVRDQTSLIPFLANYGMQADLEDQTRGAADSGARNVPGSTSGRNERAAHIAEVVQRFIRSHTYENMPWREAQAVGLLWAPLRKPHENAADPHWRARGTFAEIEHPEHDRAFTYPVSRWLSTETRWQHGRRAPLIGEDNGYSFPVAVAKAPARPRDPSAVKLSAHDKPFPLQGVRIFDFSWFLASAGGTRLAAALGAEVIKVEWKENPDTRLAAMAPVGGRAARDAATAPLPPVTDSDMGGQFNNKNAGKSGLSLNIRHLKGMEIARRMIAQSDVVAEGFSPGVLQRLGLGYDALREIKKDIIYVQQSGMGGVGSYGRFRTIGPVAAAFAGSSEMSGLPEPAMPAGWGYSFLDWMGAYGFTMAILSALLHRDRTGLGQWIDSSQCESGIMLGAVPVLDHSANGRVWSRIGNRSPYKPAAPHGAYRCAGEDRWLSIACFDDAEFRALAEVAGHPEWLTDPRFASLAARLANQDALDAAVTAWTVTQAAHPAMFALQAAGVTAGVCQNAEDRYDHDPQLSALNWLTEIEGSKIGRWPVAELPSAKLSATPGHAGGIIRRGAPGYGEDNERLLGEMLGYTAEQVRELAAEGII